MASGMTPRASHLEPEMSEHGFASLPAVNGSFAGEPRGEVNVFESSNAEGPHLWLAVNDEKIQLTAENAWRVADQLRAAVRNHYQGDSTPEWAID